MRQKKPGALKLTVRRIEKLLLLLRGRTAKKKCVDMNGPVPRGPFQALKPPRDMLRRSDLAAAVTRQVDCTCHLVLNVVEPRRDCKSLAFQDFVAAAFFRRAPL